MRGNAVLRALIERRKWAEILYAVVSVPPAAAGFVFVVLTLVLGAATSGTFIGLPVLAVGGLGARRIGGVFRRLAGAILLGEHLHQLGLPVSEDDNRPRRASLPRAVRPGKPSGGPGAGRYTARTAVTLS